MTIAIIRAALLDKLNSEAATHGENTVLSASVNTDITDKLALILDDVNPNHQYPPTTK